MVGHPPRSGNSDDDAGHDPESAARKTAICTFPEFTIDSIGNFRANAAGRRGPSGARRPACPALFALSGPAART